MQTRHQLAAARVANKIGLQVCLYAATIYTHRCHLLYSPP